MKLQDAMKVTCLSLFGLVYGSIQSEAQCFPQDFMIKDLEQTVINEQLSIAFLQTASRQQYEEGDRSGSTWGSYLGSTAGGVKYDDAKKLAQRAAESTKFSYDHSFYLNYLSMHLSPISAKMYSDCLERDKQTPGFRMWIARREGNYFTLKAFWVGGDEKTAVGKLDKPPTKDNVTVVDLPIEWVRAKTQEIVLSKAPDVDGYFSLSVGGQPPTSLVLLHDTPPIRMASHEVLGNQIRADTRHDSSRSCGPGSAQGCVTPSKKGGFLVPGTGQLTQFKVRNPSGGVDITVYENSSERICIRLTVNTGACEAGNSGEGYVSAVERYPETP
jgi:hypothetical protein